MDERSEIERGERKRGRGKYDKIGHVAKGQKRKVVKYCASFK